jgi:hypothetical protein
LFCLPKSLKNIYLQTAAMQTRYIAETNIFEGFVPIRNQNLRPLYV